VCAYFIESIFVLLALLCCFACLGRGTKVLEQKPLKLVNYGVPKGWRELPANPLEIRDYMVWTRDTYTPVVDSGKNPNP